MNRFELLVCTVGGNSAPVIATVLGHRPERTLFIASPQTAAAIGECIAPAVTSHPDPLLLTPGNHDVVLVPDAQDFTACVERIREAYGQHIGPWLARGPEFAVTVDFTGGTKCMTAALALVARRWKCRFSYVGGSERTKDGVGIVVSGTEQIIHAANPWDTFGFEAVEQAMLLFDHGDYAAAKRILADAKQGAGDEIKRGLSTLEQLCGAYDSWDRFQHRDAATSLAAVAKNGNDIRAWLGRHAGELLSTIQRHIELLNQLPNVSRLFVLDLLANARRCASRGRYDDAVARLYRACEAAAQFRIAEIGISEKSDGRVRFEKLPERLMQEWSGRRVDAECVNLGVQDGYELLREVNDPMGLTFHKIGLGDRSKSPLNERNNSILAHGQSAISTRGYDKLRDLLNELLSVTEVELPVFPRLDR